MSNATRVVESMPVETSSMETPDSEVIGFRASFEGRSLRSKRKSTISLWAMHSGLTIRAVDLSSAMDRYRSGRFSPGPESSSYDSHVCGTSLPMPGIV